MNRNRDVLLRELTELGFRMGDLHLYLDTHQNEIRAIKEYNLTANKYNTMKNHYEKLYGPLTTGDKDDHDETTWQWVKGPWPWEVTETGGAENVAI